MKANNLINVIIAEDHQVYRDGLRLLLLKDKSIQLLGEANTGRRLVELVSATPPQVVITDLKMPQMSGIEAIREIMARFPDMKIMVLTMFDDEDLLVDALEAGAIGYVMKNANREEILIALKSVAMGEPYYCLSTNPGLTRKISASQFNPYRKSKPIDLTDTEIEIIKLICNEFTNQQIADQVHLSIRSVEKVRTKIFEKLRVKSAVGLVIYAVKNGFYKII